MKNIIYRFSKVAEKHPSQLAVVTTNGSLTYEQLNQRSQILAQILDNHFRDTYHRSILPSDVIGVALKKGLDLYITLLAVLKAGASYVPLDPELDSRTITHIIETCDCELILTAADTLQSSPHASQAINVSAIKYDERLNQSISSINVKFGLDGSAVAYTIFTSGSTGKPKGVMVSHANVIHLVDWCITHFELGTSTRTLQFSTVNFDASVLDIFPTWLAGGTLFIPSAEQRMSIQAVTELCSAWEINHAFLSPSFLNALDSTKFPSIKILLTGGEPCTPEVIKKWSNGRRLYNLYGPTECTVMACYKLMSPDTDSKNIGVPMDGVQTYILDADLQCAKEGELFIAGNGVSLGYRKQDISTAEKFITLPHLTTGNVYRTGDFVRQETNGEITFLGRIDRQVKVRGYRIELEEIEGALLLAGCNSAAVKLSAQNTIIAYVVVSDVICTSNLKQELSNYLSPYKLPHHIVRLNSMPLKNNGKIDYQSLPEPVIEINNRATTKSLSEAELVLAHSWAQILDIDVSLIHSDSNFTELGGDSISIAMLLARLEEEFNISIDFIEFFENPTIKFISETLNNEESKIC